MSSISVHNLETSGYIEKYLKRKCVQRAMLSTVRYSWDLRPWKTTYWRGIDLKKKKASLMKSCCGACSLPTWVTFSVGHTYIKINELSGQVNGSSQLTWEALGMSARCSSGHPRKRNRRKKQQKNEPRWSLLIECNAHKQNQTSKSQIGQCRASVDVFTVRHVHLSPSVPLK